MEYTEPIHYNGGNCPSCNSADIEGGDLDYEGDEHSQIVNCLNCGSSWKDIYKLVGYVELEKA